MSCIPSRNGRVAILLKYVAGAGRYRGAQRYVSSDILTFVVLSELCHRVHVTQEMPRDCSTNEVNIVAKCRVLGLIEKQQLQHLHVQQDSNFCVVCFDILLIRWAHSMMVSHGWC